MEIYLKPNRFCYSENLIKNEKLKLSGIWTTIKLRWWRKDGFMG